MNVQLSLPSAAPVLYLPGHIEAAAAEHGIVPPPSSSDEAELFSTYLAWRRANEAWWQSVPGSDDDTTEDADREDGHFQMAETNLFRLVDMRASSALGIAALAHTAMMELVNDRPGTETYSRDTQEPAFKLVAGILASALGMARSERNSADS